MQVVFVCLCSFVQANYLQWTFSRRIFAHRFGNKKNEMKNNENEKNEKNEKIEVRLDQDGAENFVDPADDEMNFIKEFIEQKKLQNRILKDILENIKHTEK